MNQQDQITRIQRQQAEVREFVSEQHKLMAEQDSIFRASELALWQVFAISMTAGAALFAAGAAFMRFVSA